jgi:hypothetical protein
LLKLFLCAAANSGVSFNSLSFSAATGSKFDYHLRNIPGKPPPILAIIFWSLSVCLKVFPWA